MAGLRMTSKESGNDEDDLYSDLPNFHYEDSVKKLEEINKSLQNEKAKLEQRIVELEKLLEKNQEDNTKIQKKNKTLCYNLSSLYKTAQNEIKRKDNMIYELRREKDNAIFRRRQPDRKIKKSFYDEDRYRKSLEKVEENHRKSQERDEEDDTEKYLKKIKSTNRDEEKNFEKKQPKSENSEKHNSNTNCKESERKGEGIEESSSQSNKKVVAESNENAMKALSSINLTCDEIQNLQKTLENSGIIIKNNAEIVSEDKNKTNHQDNTSKNAEPNNCLTTNSNIIAPKLNIPLTAYTRRMYKKHYGVSPEKVSKTEILKVEEKKCEFLNESKTEVSPENVSENYSSNVNEEDCSLEKSKTDEIMQKEVNSDIHTVSPPHSEEIIENNSVRKPVRRISRVGKKSLENNIPLSDFIKLGDRNISKKAVEKRVVTDNSKISKFGQLVHTRQVTRSITKNETGSSSLTLMLSLENKKYNEQNFRCKVTPDDTIQSVIDRAKSISPKEEKNVRQRTSPRKIMPIRLKNNHRKITTKISPISSFSINNRNKQVSPVENKSPVEAKVTKEVNIMTKSESEKPKIKKCKRSRQACFLDSLFGSPKDKEKDLKPESVQKPSKEESHSETRVKNCLNSEVINGKINNKSKVFDSTSPSDPKKVTKLCNDEDVNLSQETTVIKENNQTNSELAVSSNSDILPNLFQIQTPVIKSGNINLSETNLDPVNNHQMLENNLPISSVNQMDISTFKTSSPQNSMSGYIKGTENSCFSAFEDTIGMVTALARVRTRLSPIKTPVKNSITELGDENASSPKDMTGVELNERENNKKRNTNHFSSLSSPVSSSPVNTTSEHCEFRRSRRILALVKKPLSSPLKTIYLLPNKSSGVKRNLNISDSLSDAVDTKRHKIDEPDDKNKTLVKSVNDLVTNNQKQEVIHKEDRVITPELKMSKQQCNEKENVTCNFDKKNVNEHRSSSIKKTSNRSTSYDRKKLDDKKLREAYNQRKQKKRIRRHSSSPLHSECDTKRAKQNKPRISKRGDKLRSRSASSSEERKYVDHKRNSLDHKAALLSKHRLFSSGNKSGFQRHSPSEYFNRKQKNSRRLFGNRFSRFGSPSPHYHRNGSAIRNRHTTPPRRKKSRDRNEQRKERELKEDLRKETLYKESIKNMPGRRLFEKEEKDQPVQLHSKESCEESKWKLTLISIDEKKRTEQTPSQSIENGRCDPRTSIIHSSEKIECSQEIKLNKILTDQTNQSNQIASPEMIKPTVSLDKLEEKVSKKSLVIKRHFGRNINFEDTTSDNKSNSQSKLNEKSTKCIEGTTITNTVFVNSNLEEEQEKKDNSNSQNICPLTTENVQKLNETLPSRCHDSSVHSSAFPKKIVKTPLNFRQKYASVFSNSTDSECDDPFDGVTDSDESRDSDRTWKP